MFAGLRFTCASHAAATVWAMELDEIFSPDDTDVPRTPDTDDAFEL
jgi:hypothetical protein